MEDGTDNNNEDPSVPSTSAVTGKTGLDISVPTPIPLLTMTDQKVSNGKGTESDETNTNSAVGGGKSLNQIGLI